MCNKLRLRVIDVCLTRYDIETSALTVPSEPELQKLLDKVCRQWGRRLAQSEALRFQEFDMPPWMGM